MGKKATNGSRKMYTETQFSSINDLLIQYKAIAEQKASLEAAEREIRQRLIDLTVSAITPDDKTVFPGGVIAERKLVEYDEKEALEWVLRSENLYTAAPLLTLRPEAMGIVLAQVIQNPEQKKVLGLNRNGYSAAIINGTHADAPHGEVTTVYDIRLSPDNIKTGSALRETLDIIPDDVLAEAVS